MDNNQAGRKKPELLKVLDFRDKPEGSRKRIRIDFILAIAVLVLVVFGVIMVKSASSVYAENKYNDTLYCYIRQLIFAIIGIAIAAVMSQIDYIYVKKFIFPVFALALLMLLLVYVPGIGYAAKGAKRWIHIGGFRFQPSEIMKFAFVAILAKYFSVIGDNARKFTYGILIPGSAVALVSAVTILEPHISCALIFAIIGMFMIFIAGAQKRWLGILLAAVVLGLIVVIVFTDYATARIQAWLHPESDIYGKGWQAYQSLIAIGSGGFFGKGIGNSIQKTSWLPEPQNDFIFSILCEETGFFGAFIVIALFGVVIWRGIRISLNAPDRFSKLLASGITLKLAVQVIFNIAVVTASVPTTGISLPFFSYGGTALIMQLFEIGVLLSISRYTEGGES